MGNLLAEVGEPYKLAFGFFREGDLFGLAQEHLQRTHRFADPVKPTFWATVKFGNL